mgnify:CR=1 FL=1
MDNDKDDDDDDDVTLGYAETLERDVRRRDRKIQSLSQQIAELNELNETNVIQLNAAKNALAQHADMYHGLEQKYNKESAALALLRKDKAKLEQQFEKEQHQGKDWKLALGEVVSWNFEGWW